MINLLDSKKIDKHRTSYFLGDFGCADVFGGTFLSNTPEGFLNNLRKLGAEVSEWEWSKEGWFKKNVLEVTPEAEPFTPEEEVTPPTEEIEKVRVTPDVDWEWVESLTNTSPSKKKLEEYARDFNVELKRNKTLSNMIIDFKEALDV